MKTFSKSSLIISTYNWPEALRLCLLSVKEQSVLPDEVIVADDGSTGATAELIEALRPAFPVRLIHVWQADEGFQLSKIRNKAIATSSCDYIIQIDGDLILHRHFIKDHLALSKRGTFVAGSRVLMNKELSEKTLHQQQPRVAPFQSGLGNFSNRFSISWLSRYMADRYKTQDIFALRGCNMAFWRDDLLRVNGYNEIFHAWGREDNEIAVRLLNAGLRKRAIKFGGVVFHIYHPEADRAGCPENEAYLTDARLQKTVFCSLGLHQYLHAAEPAQLVEKEFAL
ncbi:glycosyltransferase family 2 protein [Dyadobacter fermentans]|uniref:Glycosyl transferase family 2 n=1 Tax=Dyadobacter fermentans (strain ATCC 700827 / DSM 18053 / CIP 107007 / KCTC 52180 / NS114) TaxID=471854 RepID=C6VRT9_DYAFD|nr:glycosyltransferase family 2 protein [Dyadobacter fermentans]ACT92792.1 glycosyl transferase family 2 [Dyadobacter fermentans DSM 18053]